MKCAIRPLNSVCLSKKFNSSQNGFANVTSRAEYISATLQSFERRASTRPIYEFKFKFGAMPPFYFPLITGNSFSIFISEGGIFRFRFFVVFRFLYETMFWFDAGMSLGAYETQLYMDLCANVLQVLWHHIVWFASPISRCYNRLIIIIMRNYPLKSLFKWCETRKCRLHFPHISHMSAFQHSMRWRYFLARDWELCCFFLRIVIVLKNIAKYLHPTFVLFLGFLAFSHSLSKNRLNLEKMYG